METQSQRRLIDLELLASAVAARPLQVFQSAKQEPSYCDGTCVYTDPTLDANQLPEVVLVHAALVAGGSLEPARFRALRGRPGAARRYLALELPRVLKEQDEWLPTSLLRRIPVPSNRDSDGPTSSLRRSLDRRIPVEEAAEYLGTIRPFRMVATMSAVRSQGLAVGKMNEEGDAPEHDEDAELDDSGDWLMKKFTALVGGSGGLTDLLRNLLGSGHSPGRDESDDLSVSGGVTKQVIMSQAVAGAAESDSQATTQPLNLSLLSEPTEWQYPEWNVDKNRYQQDWVKISEIEPWKPREMAQMEYCDISSTVIKNQLLRVGVEFEMHNRQPNGDDLDLDALVDYATELAVHHTPNENVYRASQRSKRDLSVLILLDSSQSTSDVVDSKTSIFGQHREAVRQIANAFSLFGDRVAVYGFHSWGRMLTRFLRVKSFDESMSSRVHQRLNWIEPAGLTRIGAAIRHATALLLSGKYHTHRLILLLSDGFAYDDEYEGRYAEADTLKSLREARDRGIACICVNIGTSKDDEALKRLYGESTYLRAAHASELPGRLKRMMNAAIYQASRSGTRQQR